MTDKKGTGAQRPQAQKFIIPMAKDPAKAALEAATKAAHEAALQAASHIEPTPPPDESETKAARGALHINKRKTVRRVTRQLQDPFAWLKSPGTLIMGVASKWMVEDNAKARQQKKRKGEILRLRFAHYENDPNIYFWVTDPKDPDGYDLELEKGQLVVNISDWLFEEDLAPAPGISQKFDLIATTEQELGGPVLRFNTEQARKIKKYDPSRAKDEDGEDDENE